MQIISIDETTNVFAFKHSIWQGDFKLFEVKEKDIVHRCLIKSNKLPDIIFLFLGLLMCNIWIIDIACESLLIIKFCNLKGMLKLLIWREDIRLFNSGIAKIGEVVKALSYSKFNLLYSAFVSTKLSIILYMFLS